MADFLTLSSPYDVSFTLGNALYIVTGVVVFLGLILALVFAIRASNANNDRLSHTESQTPRIKKRRPTVLKTWFRRKFCLPALFGHRHGQPVGWFVLPTRGQTLMVAFFLLLNIVLMVVKYPQGGKTVKAVADRAGHLSMVNMPIFFMLFGRNNILIFVTGWQYRDFQVFHKWIARISSLEMIIHGAGYGYMSALRAKKSPQKVNYGSAYENAWWNGVAAIGALAVLVLFSVFPIRRKAYELFLISHIVGTACFLGFLYNHVSPSNHPYGGYIWACVAIWALDRFFRLLRLVVLNVKGRHMGRARLIPGTTTIVYSVYPSVKEVGFAPAAHYFIYMPERFAFWESHPFTAASWRSGSNRRNHQAPDKVITALQDIKYLESGYKSSSTSSDGKRKTTTITMTTKELGRKPTAPKKAKLTFLIQARSGMTHKLCQRILDSRDGYVDIPCLLEGPYGKLRPVSAFPTVVVIAGGVGISTALPYLRKHLYRGRDPTRRFALIWTLRDAEVADNILQEVKGLSFRPDVSVKVYITGGEDRNREGSGKDKELGLGMGGGGCWRMPLGVDVKYRRPRIAEAIVRESEARVPGTPMAVIACGSGSVVDAARQGAVKALEGAAGSKGMGEVMYWEEGHGW